MSTFRFLHISDLHISVTPRKIGVADISLIGIRDLPRMSLVSSQDPAMLEALARLAYERSRGIDAILITGDLATTGGRDDIEEAFSFVDDPAAGTDPWMSAKSRPTLQGARRPIFLIPGNHDRFKGVWCKPGGKEFDSVFVKYWYVGQSAQVLGLIPDNSPELAVIGADFTLAHKSHAKSHRGRWGQGRAYKKTVIPELKRLTNALRSANPRLGVIWMSHFPPDFPEEGKNMELVEESELIDAATTSSVSVLLTGHTHNPKRFSIYRKNLEVLCAGTATQLTAPVGHVVHLMEVDVSPAGAVEVRRQDLWWREDHSSFI